MNEKIYKDWSDPKNRVTRGKAIRLKCLDCCAGYSAEVKSCSITTCPLFPFRMGVAIPEFRKKRGQRSRFKNDNTSRDKSITENAKNKKEAL